MRHRALPVAPRSGDRPKAELPLEVDALRVHATHWVQRDRARELPGVAGRPTRSTGNCESRQEADT
jgi:hypothetical protein